MSTDLLDDPSQLPNHAGGSGGFHPAMSSSSGGGGSAASPPPTAAAAHSSASSPAASAAGSSQPLAQRQPQASSRRRWQLQFRINKANLGSGTLRQITYFPLEVVPSPQPPESDTPISWANEATYVYRRYSEVVRLRRYLMLKNPGELIPSLPAKTSTESFHTAMCDGSTLEQQTSTLRFFCDILATKPRVYMHDPIVAQFVQLPREQGDLPPDGPEQRGPTAGGARSFASFAATMSRLEQEIKDMERCLDRTDPRVFASSSTAAMGGLMRSTAKALSGWWGGGKKGSSGGKDELQVTEDEIMAFCAKDQNFCLWSRFRDMFVGEAARLDDALITAKRAKEEASELLAAEKDVSAGLLGLADALSEEADKDLRRVVGGVCELSSVREETANAARINAAKTVHMLFSEALCVQGIVEAIDLLLNRYRALAALELNKIDRITPERRRVERTQLTNTAGSLNTNIKHWVLGLRSRIKDLGTARARGMSAALQGSLDNITRSSVYRAMTRDDFLKQPGDDAEDAAQDERRAQ